MEDQRQRRGEGQVGGHQQDDAARPLQHHQQLLLHRGGECSLISLFAINGEGIELCFCLYPSYDSLIATFHGSGRNNYKNVLGCSYL